MTRGRRTPVIAGVGVGVALGLSTVALGLWSSGNTTAIPLIQTGKVSFSVQDDTDDATRVYSQTGEAVSVVLPGSVIAQVLDQTGVDPAPVIWRFSASGAALGITGLVYDVAVVSQGPGVSASQATDLTSGVARDGTLLASSLLKIYPAAAGGDCSSVPATPESADGETTKNVYLYDNQQAVLQEPGTNLTGDVITEQWCAALQWTAELDGAYLNNVRVIGTADDGSTQGATAAWNAVIAYPPSLDAMGLYLNRARVESIGEDHTTVTDEDEWYATVYPDPSREPDVTITFDPAVTNVNPSVAQQ